MDIQVIRAPGPRSKQDFCYRKGVIGYRKGLYKHDITIYIRLLTLKRFFRQPLLSALSTLLRQGISEPEFCGDLVYRFRKNVGESDFSEQFRELVNGHKNWLWPGYCAAGCVPGYRPGRCWWLCFALWLRGGGSCLAVCLWLGPPWFSCWLSFTLAYSRVDREYSSLFIVVINLIYMFSL